jgi:hypothetical protein
MPKKESGLEYYLNSQNETKAADKLANYQALSKGMDLSNSNNMLGRLVHTLVLKGLINKAHEENDRNIKHKKDMFEKYHKDRFDEKKYLELMKAQLEEKKERREREKEERHHAYDEKKEERQFGRDIAKAKTTSEINHAESLKNKQIDAITKSFDNPIDALKFMANPQEEAKNMEFFDNNSMVKKAYGKLKQKLGGTYTPNIRTRLKK